MELPDLQRKSVPNNQNTPSYLTKPLDLLSAPCAMGSWALVTGTTPPTCFVQLLLLYDLVFLLAVFSALYKAKRVKLKTLPYFLTSQLFCAFPINGCCPQLEMSPSQRLFMHLENPFLHHWTEIRSVGCMEGIILGIFWKKSREGILNLQCGKVQVLFQLFPL